MQVRPLYQQGHHYLKAKLRVETFDISKEKIREILQKRNVEFNDIEDFNTNFLYL